jgi:Uma2 family endonuclease
MAVPAIKPASDGVGDLPKRLFTDEEYDRMVEVGILPEGRMELIGGVVYEGPRRRRRFTVDDLQRMVEAGVLREDERVELIEGEVVQMMTIGDRHARCVRGLIELFEERPRGRALLDVQNPIRLAGGVQVQADLALLRRRPDGYASLPTPADVLLAVEVCDTSAQLDRTVKVPLYAHNGVRELWLVDLSADVVEVHRRPAPAGYLDVRPLRRGESVAPEALADFPLSIDAILG